MAHTYRPPLFPKHFTPTGRPVVLAVSKPKGGKRC